MNAEIITVGTELLLGDILDSNSQFLSRELAECGINMLYQSTVGDNGPRLSQVLSLALSRSDLIVVTGGLGPTADDLTRETVCETLGVPLEFHQESWDRITEYFAASGREIPESNLQAGHASPRSRRFSQRPRHGPRLCRSKNTASASLCCRVRPRS